MNNIDKNYKLLVLDVLDNGKIKGDRTGTGTISLFGKQIRHKMKEGFPLLTTKKVHFKSVVTELIWFLKGDTNIKYLVDNGCNIWNGDAYKNYLNSNISDYTIEKRKVFFKQDDRDGVKEIDNYKHYDKEEFSFKIKTDISFSKAWGELGPIYGTQWRKHGDYLIGNDKNYKSYYEKPSIKYIDQISNLIKDIKENPDSRRLMVNSWDVSNIENMTLPPCHYGFQIYTNILTIDEKIEYAIEKCNADPFELDVKMSNSTDIHNYLKENYDLPERSISLLFNMRSCDIPLGLPFNIASYGLLLEIIAKLVNMVPDELIVNIGDAHIYADQINGIKEQIDREPYDLPFITIDDSILNTDISNYTQDLFKMSEYKSHSAIKMPLSN